MHFQNPDQLMASENASVFFYSLCTEIIDFYRENNIFVWIIYIEETDISN
jgi:hypothetical protein